MQRILFFAHQEKTPEKTRQVLETRIGDYFNNDSIKILEIRDMQYKDGIGRLIAYESLPYTPPEEITPCFSLPDDF